MAVCNNINNVIPICNLFRFVQNRACGKSLNFFMKNPYRFAKNLFEQNENSELQASRAEVEAHSACLENFLVNLAIRPVISSFLIVKPPLQ